MRTRMTFRLPDDLADGIRSHANQTAFVEQALRNALGQTCPVCTGSGRVPWKSLRVSNFRSESIPHLDRPRALQLKSVIQMAKALAATDVRLRTNKKSESLSFLVARGQSVLVRGSLAGSATVLEPKKPEASWPT